LPQFVVLRKSTNQEDPVTAEDAAMEKAGLKVANTTFQRTAIGFLLAG
jgi:hypothetical protein